MRTRALVLGVLSIALVGCQSSDDGTSTADSARPGDAGPSVSDGGSSPAVPMRFDVGERLAGTVIPEGMPSVSAPLASTPQLSASIVRLRNEARIHRHPTSDEHPYVLLGTGVFLSVPGEHAVAPGSTVHVPMDTWHQPKAAAVDAELALLVISLGAGGIETGAAFPEVGDDFVANALDEVLDENPIPTGATSQSAPLHPSTGYTHGDVAAGTITSLDAQHDASHVIAFLGHSGPGSFTFSDVDFTHEGGPQILIVIPAGTHFVVAADGEEPLRGVMYRANVL